MRKNNVRIFKIIIGTALFSICGICSLSFWAISDFFGGNSSNENNVSFTDALAIFDITDEVSIIGSYEFYSVGFLDHNYKLNFDTDIEGIKKLQDNYELTDDLVNLYNSNIDAQNELSFWNENECNGLEIYKYGLEIQSLSYAYITFCEIKENQYQVYLFGFTT